MGKNIEDDIMAMVGDDNSGGDDDAEITNPEGGEQDAGDEDADATRSSAIDVSTVTNAGEGVDTKQGKKPTGPKPLIDKDGSVIAEGGRERRFYEAAQTARADATRLQGELDKALARINGFESAGSIATQLKLSPDESIQGQKIMAAFKANPVETIKYLLTEAQAAGHNTSEIGSGGNLTADAVKSMIDNAFKPLNEDRDRVRQSSEAEQRAVTEYNAFTTRFPDVKIHESTIARMLENDKSLSPDTAYYKLRSFYLEKQLDWAKSLETLADEMEKAKTQQGKRESHSPGLPGRGTSADTTGTRSAIADVDASTDDIVKEAMREAGITIQ